MLSAAAVLDRDGPVAGLLPGFAPRAAQRAMAEAVAAAMEARTTLICEAGTGTGKTFAYLVPALLSGGKVIVSTGTKTLQDQLFHRDLPLVRRALDIPVSVALLKGRANYVCPHRLALTEQEGRLASRHEVGELQRVLSWSRRTRSGDIAEVDDLAEDASIWPSVTSTADNCLGQECSRFSDCFVLKARRAAQEADVVVINHHLLLADMALKDEGFGELLPSADAFIIDEAHQLPETAAQFFGTGVSSRQLLELVRDTVAEHQREAGDMAELTRCARRLEKAVLDARLAMGAAGRRGAWRELNADPAVAEGLHRIRTALSELQEVLELAAERGKGLQHCWQRSGALGERLALFQQAPEDEQVQWFETYTRSFSLHLTPLQVGNVFQNHRQRFRAAWIFTSATLAVGDDFSHFSASLGVEDGQTAQWESPFDFKNNALLYIPKNLPLPAVPHYTAEVVKAALPVLQASGGRAFLLFTSHRALQEAAGLLNGRIDFPLLIQGSAPRRELLQRFRDLGNAVLLGTSSFWEGVDVRGPALSLVVIDKLPFASPGEPVLQARLESLRSRGGEPFRDYQLPQAVIALKQGVGRLIRDSRDCGVLMLCDPRLLSKAYGRIFLASLPPMTHTRVLADVQRFFDTEAAAQAGPIGRIGAEDGVPQ
ncbi:MAG: ATP-dependent DNA helicase [Gammaproteobacteria bacterium]|jgi:ATP-dependent DNA helicase DinG